MVRYTATPSREESTQANLSISEGPCVHVAFLSSVRAKRPEQTHLEEACPPAFLVEVMHPSLQQVAQRHHPHELFWGMRLTTGSRMQPVSAMRYTTIRRGSSE